MLEVGARTHIPGARPVAASQARLASTTSRASGRLQLPIDSHIPGAINHFWKNNLDETGFFKKPDQIREVFMDFLGVTEPSDAVFYCGSGVTACHNLLAAAHAGLTAPKLYVGSWSEWCADPERPVAIGEA